MARLKSPARPAIAPDDPKRRQWTISLIRNWGWEKLGGLHGTPESVAWHGAWRTFDGDGGACPVDEALSERAIAEWPQRTTYPTLIADWRQRQATTGRTA